MRNITDPSQIKTIALFRALNLGDMLCAVPALRSLRRWLPGTSITYIGLPSSRSFFTRFRHYLDEFVEFPGYPGLPGSSPHAKTTLAFLASMQEKHYDLAIQMHGSESAANSLVSMFGALVTAGFCADGDSFFSDGWAIPYPDGLSETERCLKLMETIGAPPESAQPEFPLTEQDVAELRRLPETASLSPASYIILHPGAKRRIRRWLPERFAAVGDALSSCLLRVVITGSHDEQGICARVQSHMQHHAVNLAGRTTLGALAALVKNSRLVIANDTGISPIASALQVPSITVITSSNPGRWEPRDARLNHTVQYPVPCRPCSFPVCPVGHPCAQSVEAETVIAEARQILKDKNTPSHAVLPHKEQA